MKPQSPDRGDKDCIHVRTTVEPELPELPVFSKGVVMQSFTSDGEGELYGFRIFGDGQRQRLEPDEDWREASPLSTAAVADIRRAVGGLDLDSIAGTHRLADLPDDPSVSILQVEPRPERAVLIAWPCRVPAVDEFFAQIGPLLDP